MRKGGAILYCDCAYTELAPASAKARVREGLTAGGLAYTQVADLCELAARRDGRLAGWAAEPRLQIIACYPRAARWLFSAGGAPLRKDARIWNLRTQGAEEIVAGVREACGGDGAAGGQGGKEGAAETIASAGGWTPWFPAIDYDRCVGCKTCYGFCLFGVYALEGEGRVTVANPAACKTNCPACARVCPQAAIIFPKYAAAPINGGEGSAAEAGRDEGVLKAAGEAAQALEGEEAVGVDLRGLLKGDVYATLRRRGMREHRTRPPA